MPDIEMPNGDIVNFPDDMPDAQIKSMIASKFPELGPQEQAPQQEQSFLGAASENLQAIQAGVADMAFLGGADEAKAGLMAGVRGTFDPDVTVGEAYESFLPQQRARQEQLQQDNPYAYGTGQVAGAIGAPALAVPKAVAKGVANFAGKGLGRSALASGGIGGVSGGLYGAGSGEGAQDRLKTGLEHGAYGVAGGAALAGAGALAHKGGRAVLDMAADPNSLVSKATNIFNKKRAARMQAKPASAGLLTDVAERGDELTPLPQGQGQAAYSKVSKALKEDLGADYDDVLKAYKEGGASLIELNQSRSRTLAQGAAQYSGGKATAQGFFDPKIAASQDRILKSIRENVTGIDAYYANADDLLAAGRAKAAPLYKEIDDVVVDLGEEIIDDAGNVLFNLPKEVQTAIAKARRQDPSKLDGLPDNSVKVLDAAKRLIDDDIGQAKRAGRGGFVASRTQIKNDLLDTIDKQVPGYAKARAVAGDYLSINEAMENGRKALKIDPELIAKQFKGLAEKEREAFQVGLGKAIRDEVSSVTEGANPYRRILGTPAKQARIKSILSPAQYKNLAADLSAEDRLFKMKNEILGGSPTAGKQEAKNLIASAAQGVDTVAQIPRQTMKGIWGKMTDGLNDKVATKVSEILYETDPIKKLAILDGLKGSKTLTQPEKRIVKELYFETSSQFDAMRASYSAGGGSLAQPTITGNE